jgi:hypothetical protein
VSERGEGAEKEYLAFWKPRKKYDVATWENKAHFSACRDQWVIDAFHNKRRIATTKARKAGPEGTLGVGVGVRVGVVYVAGRHGV